MLFNEAPSPARTAGPMNLQKSNATLVLGEWEPAALLSRAMKNGDNVMGADVLREASAAEDHARSLEWSHPGSMWCLLPSWLQNTRQFPEMKGLVYGFGTFAMTYRNHPGDN